MDTTISRYQPAQTYIEIKQKDEKAEARATLIWDLTELALTVLVVGCLAYGLWDGWFHV